MDICAICFKYNQKYRNNVKVRRQKDPDRVHNNIIYGTSDDTECDSDKDSDDSDDSIAMNHFYCKPCDDEDDSNNKKDDDDHGFDSDIDGEEEFLAVARHIEEAKSMRDYVTYHTQLAKQCTIQDVEDRDMHIQIVADFCQNLEMLSFRSVHPGETYYLTPMTVPTLGIVDCNSKDNMLYAYIYSEAEGNKGGNIVASLIMMHLRERGLLDDKKKRLKLSVVMDNCGGQNKNGHVLRLAPYLLEKNYFYIVEFQFLVAGHTKNEADKRFNNLKQGYRHKNIYTMDQLVKTCNESPYVNARQVYWDDFYDYNKFFESIYKKLHAVKKYQIFSSMGLKTLVPPGERAQDGIGMVQFKTSDLEDAEVIEQNIIKTNIGTTERQSLLNAGPEKMYTQRPGLSEIKQVELFTKWRHLLDDESKDITCPEPSKEASMRVKEAKIERKKLKEDVKKKKAERDKNEMTAKKKPTKKRTTKKSNVAKNVPSDSSSDSDSN